MSNNRTCLSKFCFLKKLPQFFFWRNSARIMGIHTTGPAVKDHISSEMARELIAIFRTMYHLWFLVYQTVHPQLYLHLLLHHLHHRIPYLMSTDTPKIQYHKRSGSTSEELRGDPLHESTKTENKSKNGNRKKYKEKHRMNCLIGYRNSGRICLITVLQQSLGETQSTEVKTLPSHLMNFQWSRGQKWNRVRVSTVYIYALSEGPQLRYLLEDENNQGFLQKTYLYIRAQSGTFW